MPQPSHREQRANMFCKLKRGIESLEDSRMRRAWEAEKYDVTREHLIFKFHLPCSILNFHAFCYGRNQRKGGWCSFSDTGQEGQSKCNWKTRKQHLLPFPLSQSCLTYGESLVREPLPVHGRWSRKSL